MEAREIITVQACGIDGNHGTVDYGDKRAPQAGYGRRGLDGRSATVATDGTPGTEARVRLSYSPTNPGHVMVVGEGAQTGYNWEMANSQALHLDCHGGEGGNGGRGEDGQQGGNGLPGRDASKYYDATPGEDGGPGGNAGAGSNGANGGGAGSVFISVAEHDLDALVGVTWNITGGKGGQSGTHGTPGDGGFGGRGGDGCAWTERSGNYVSAGSRPGAAHGAPGAQGRRPGTYLSGGQAGPNGSCQIRVVMKDLTEATYPDRYRIQVVGFDVIDENEDNINEPGEHLCVRNVRVQNFGGMPSPGKECPIKVLVHGTPWLEPIESEPLYLPPNIPVGSTVTVPGTLRCLIRSESTTRAVGQHLFEKDTVSLIASFERLGRKLPEFNGTADIVIQYPLILDPPKVLLSVAKGDLVRFHWTLRNISSKAYGFQGSLRRSVSTVLSDPDSAFNLTYSDTAQGGQAVDEIDLLEPGAAVPIEQDFRVSDDAEDYSYAHLRLELQLSNPNLAVKARTVANAYGMQLQISGKYTFDPYAQFLLVVNSHTPLFAIHQIRRFIWNTLSLRVDTFNISLYGSLNAPESGNNVLGNYVGKSVIIFGNTLPFFDLGDRQPWDLLDPWELCTWAKAGTNLYIASPTDFKALDEWAQMVSFPAGEVPMLSSNGEDHTHGKALAKTIQQENHSVPVHGHGYHQLKAKKATPQVKQMSKRLPLKRFLAIRNENGVALVEGLPKSAQIFGSGGAYTDGEQIADCHAFMIIRSIPFAAQVKMFWNVVGQATSDGVLRRELYAGLPDFQPREVPGTNWESFVIQRKWLDALAWSIESQVGIEVARFCSRSSWPDPIASKNIISQLPLLSQLLSGAPTSPAVTNADGADLLVGVLGTVCGSTKNIGFGRMISQRCYPFQLGSRKAKLRKAVHRNIEGSLKTYAPSAAPELVKKIRAQAKSTKREIKETRGKKVLAPVSQQRLVIKTGTNANYIDLNTGYNKRSIAPKAPQLRAMTNAQDQHKSNRNAAEIHSAAVLNDMVNPDGDAEDETSDAPTDSQPLTPQISSPMEVSIPSAPVNELSSNLATPKIGNVVIAELPSAEVY